MSAPASRYDTILKLASGGMATVWVGTVRGALGFRQLVAIKKPHPHLVEDPSFRSEIIAEARLASMIHHANVVDVRDVEVDGDSVSLIMDYIEGASLAELLVAATEKKDEGLPPRVAVRIAIDALAGLHAAHDLVDERGRPVGLIHRDVSPQNILVGTDGMARVADFGVAKFSRKNMASTSDGSLKGKLAYMAPEYVRGETIDRRFDIFAMGIVLWEMLTGRRCFRGDNEADTLHRLLTQDPEPISRAVPGVSDALDAILACALSKSRDGRFNNAAAMAAALEQTGASAGLLGGHAEVAATVKALAGARIEERRTLVRARLASEPSVASLMGNVAPMAGAPSRTPSSPPPTVPAATIVPSTKPMTPRMEGAPPRPDAGAFASGPTMLEPTKDAFVSGPTMLDPTKPVMVLNANANANANASAEANATHPSAGVLTQDGLVIATAQTMLAADAPASIATSSRAYYNLAEAAGVPPPRRWVLPLVVGVTTAVLAGSVGYRLSRSPVRGDAAEPAHDAPTTASAGGSPSSTGSSNAVNAPSVTSAPGVGSAAGPASASGVASAPSASPSANVATTTTARPTGAPRPPAHLPAPSARKPPPPPNPYEKD